MAKNELHILKNDLLVQVENEIKNHLINLTHGCLCSDQVDDTDLYRSVVDGNAKRMILF